MDAYEATKIVMSRIQTLDPENVSKIMGYILIQDQGDKEMIRLAFCPEALLLSHINQAKACLGLSSNTPSPKPSTPLPNSVLTNSPFPLTSPGIMIPNNGFRSSSNPSSPAAAAFPGSSPRPISYAAVLNGSSSSNNGGDEFMSGDSMADPIVSPSGWSDSMVFPYREDASSLPSPNPFPFHRRSCSVNDAAFLSNLDEWGGGGWKPCMYFTRGFCKNGSSCKFSHGDVGDGETIEVGSRFDEFFRMKALRHQRLALMASGGHHPFPHNKNDFSPLGLNAGVSSSSSRQIYLTFPADSTFKEEDVCSYFSMFGPVQDVRIPYQHKRMFGFVTFVYPETVKLILGKGNPHFVCDSRVLVKPYKEKGKILDKKQFLQQHQQLEIGDYSGSLSPSGIDSGELFDHLPVGPRMLMNTQEMMLRRKLEQEAELQHAIELHRRRMTNLQLMDPTNQHHNHHFLQSVPAGFPVSSVKQSRLLMDQNVITSSDATNQDVLQVFGDGQEPSESLPVAADDEKSMLEGTESSNKNTSSGNNHQHVNDDDSHLSESLEHNLPENLFSSSTEADNNSIHITNTSSNNSPALPNSSLLSVASQCYSRTASH